MILVFLVAKHVRHFDHSLINEKMSLRIISIFVICLFLACNSFCQQSSNYYERNRIQPYLKNPRYWQYKGSPVLLIGGSKEDNLFQIPDLEEHLDLLSSVGGNYIRNTMSSRDEGNVQPFAANGEMSDLTQWNEEYWDRFENMLKLTNDREIIVQIELWAIWDMYGKQWQVNPWNPGKNVNYTFENTQLKPEYDTQGVRPWQSGLKHDFLLSVPNLSNNNVLLRYQQLFVDKILSYTLNYDNVLYCITNEIFVQFSPEWGWYWARYLRKKAEELGKNICVAEMYQWPMLRHEQHKGSLDHPEIFDYEDISQNSGRYGLDENHWVNLRYVYDYISSHPRPINHVKTYGSAEAHGVMGIHDAREKFLRSIIGGAASIRFHRPTSGIGLNQEAQTTLKMVRKLEEFVKMWELEAHMELLEEREFDEAYLAADPGEKYVLYFTNPGAVTLDLSSHKKEFSLKWLNVSTGDWESINNWVYEDSLHGGEKVKISTPTRNACIAVIFAK